MSRSFFSLLLTCCLLPSLVVSAGSDPSPRDKLSPAMQRMTRACGKPAP